MKIKETQAPTVLSPSDDTPKTIQHTLTLNDMSLSLEMGITRRAHQSILLQTETTSILGVLNVEVPLNLQEGEQKLTVDYQESAILNSDTSKYQHARLQRYKSRVIDSAIRSLFDRHRKSNINVLIQVLSTTRDADTLGLSITLAGLLCQLAGFTKSPVIGATFNLQSDRKPSSVPDWMLALTPEGLTLLQGSETQGYAPHVLSTALRAQMDQLDLKESLETVAEFVHQHHQVFPLPSLSDHVPPVEHDLIEHPSFGEECIEELIHILEESNPTLKNQRYQILVDRLAQEVNVHESSILATLRLITSEYLRSLAFDQTRLDGRQLNEIRPLILEHSKLPNSNATLVS
jgi:polyribonucleotide nucleotidyltransferase